MKTIKNKYSLYLLAIIAALGCLLSCTRKADTPQPAEESPVFGTSCLIGKDSVKLYAGKNDYYLNTSYLIDSTGILMLSGELKKQNCTACTEVLKVVIYDDTARNSITNIAKVLAIGNRKYADNNMVISPPRVVQFTEEFNGTAYMWSFGDGNTATAANPTHTYANGGQYQVCLSVTDTFGHTMQVCNNIVVDDTKKCNIQFSTGNTSSSIVTFIATGGHAQYAWDFNDFTGITTPSASPTITHTFANGPGTYKVSVIARNSNGCDSVFTKYIPVISRDTSGAAYRYTILPGSNSNTLNFSKVIVTWTNSSGKQYCSRKTSGIQPSQSFFTITNSNPYKIDVNGHLTYKITARLQAVLYNTSNPLDSINISTDKLIIALAYP